MTYPLRKMILCGTALKYSYIAWSLFSSRNPSIYTLRRFYESNVKMIYTGSCYCREIKYEVNLSSPDEARTSLCHCKSCKVKFLRAKNGNLPIDVFFEQKFFGTAFGLTAKIPRSSFKITSGKPKVHESDNGSRSLLHREFCPTCGSGILEYCVSDERRPIESVLIILI